jgi:hypothetical protein
VSAGSSRLEGTFPTWFSQIWPLMLVAWRLSERNRCSQNETMTIPAGYSEAMEKVRELASASRVDGWFTVNHTNFTRVATHRS